MSRTLLCRAPAKLNLALAVGPATESGMHPICSWMVTVDLFDDLHLTRLEHDRASRYAIVWHADAHRRTAIDWSVTKDLAVRAHQALEQAVGRPLPLQAKLEKRIPVGGGLGGGSSDAAAMLVGINRLFDLGLSTERLARIGATLGSDVPFLITGGSATVQGLGDELVVHPTLPAVHAVLVFPQAACPTANVYRELDAQRAARDEADAFAAARDAVHALVESAAGAQRMSDLAQAMFNHLAEPALNVAPSLGECIAHMQREADRPVHVSGSGSTLFALAHDEHDAASLARRLADALGLPAVAVKSHASA